MTAAVPDNLRQQVQSALGSQYMLERELGGGGMSHVFLARDAELDRQIVIKVLPPDAAAAVSAERFRREIMLAARLQHPHVVPLLSAGQTSDGLPFYTMPFVEGESLRSRLAREGELPVAEAVGILREVARALAYAHARGIVHRDIKPDNVMLSGGSAMVTDFGVAKAVTASTTSGEYTSLTQLGVALGTPPYMAPEQAAAEPTVDHRADIYAFGCLAYEVLTGSPPFSGRAPRALLAAHISERPEPIANRRPNIPPLLADLVMQCLEKRPADRPRSAEEILRALDQVVVTPQGAASIQMTAATRQTYASGASGRAAAPRWHAAVPWAVAIAALAAAAAIVVRSREVSERNSPPAIRALLPIPDSVGWDPLAAGSVILPGDSLLVLYNQTPLGLTQNVPRLPPMRLVRLATGEVMPLRGTEGAIRVTASPDGRSLAYLTTAQLWRISLSDDSPTPLGAMKAATSIAWLDNGRIVVGEDEGATLTMVAADGGGVKDTLQKGLGRAGGLGALPGGRVVVGGRPMAVLDVERRTRKMLTLEGPLDSTAAEQENQEVSGQQPRWLPSGHLAWLGAGRRLMIAPFDARTLKFRGRAVTIADSVSRYAFGTRGLLTLVRSPNPDAGVLVVADQAGKRDTLPYPAAEYRTFDVSPDQTRIAVVVAGDRGTELRLLDTRRNASRVLLGPGSNPHEPRWSPDGRRIAVQVNPRGRTTALVLLSPHESNRVDTLYRGRFIPHAWSADGKEIAGTGQPGGDYGVLMRFRPGQDTAPRLFHRQNGIDWYQSFSSDGRWYTFATAGYSAEEDGTYVAENRPGAAPVRIGGFDDPQWTHDGRSIIGLSDRTWLTRVSVTRSGDQLDFGEPVRLFAVERFVDFAGHDLKVTRDGRIVFVEGIPIPRVNAITVITDWRAEYARRGGKFD